ncbi:MAG TPA: ATP-dependent Clp protease adapter ClpS [bacterium]|nr:ATP-dependent Clp protease adapter ClpS [bacterium]HPS28885.1 ATP-dependent Clp protease adapter ClpS [bacterium]
MTGIAVPEGTTKVKNKAQSRIKRPSMYKVIMLNDNYTTMEFVVDILKKIFDKTAVEATEIMLTVHNDGKGIAGIYCYDIAITKSTQVRNEAKKSGFPLKCIIEKE